MRKIGEKYLKDLGDLPRPTYKQELFIVVEGDGAVKFCDVSTGSCYRLMPGDVVNVRTGVDHCSDVIYLEVEGGPFVKKVPAFGRWPGHDEPVTFGSLPIISSLTVVELIDESSCRRVGDLDTFDKFEGVYC